MNYDDVLTEISAAASLPMALMPERVTAVASVISDSTQGKDIPPSRLRAALSVRSERPRGSGVSLLPARNGASTAIVPISGVCLHGAHLPPLCTSMIWLRLTIEQLASDKKISSIVLNVASPGGVVTGVAEAANAIYAARHAKPIVAVINPLAASAAYHLASQASQVVSVPSGEAGSIGVFVLHFDVSEALRKEGIKPTFIKAGEKKVDGNSFEPLTESARADIQRDVNLIHLQFLMAVARGRGVSVADVRENFGKGRVFMAGDALRRGLIDKIGNFESVLPVGPASVAHILREALNRKEQAHAT